MSFLVWWDSVGTAFSSIADLDRRLRLDMRGGVVAALVAVADIRPPTRRPRRADVPTPAVLRRWWPHPVPTSSPRQGAASLRLGGCAGDLTVLPCRFAIADEIAIGVAAIPSAICHHRSDIGSAAPSITEIVLHDVGPSSPRPPFHSDTPCARHQHSAGAASRFITVGRRRPCPGPPDRLVGQATPHSRGLSDRGDRRRRTQRDANPRLGCRLLGRVARGECRPSR